MTDETTGATGTQADPGTQPQAGTATTQAEGAEGEQGQQPESFSLEDAKKLRSENRSLRTRLTSLESAERQRQEASLSEQERRDRAFAEEQRQRQDAARERDELRLTLNIERAAREAGFADPTIVTRLLDHAALEIEDDGTPKDLKAQLDKLAKTYPALLSKPASPGSGDLGTGGGQAAAARTYTREQLRDPAFFKENEKDILVASREGRITG
jgi:Phage minor structural protein GP20